MSVRQGSRIPAADLGRRLARSGRAVGVALRIAIFCTGFAALQSALPDRWHWALVLSMSILTPLLAAFLPRSGWTTATVLIALGSWIVVGQLQGGSWLHAGFIGCLSYGHHATAAVAAAWRECNEIEPAVWQSWARRQGAALGVSALLATVIVALSGAELALPAPGTLLLVTAVCVALAVIVAISYLYHRRPPSRDSASEDTEP